MAQMFNSKIFDGIIGVAIGDALGVPVEFQSRAEIAGNPVISMRGYGTHHQPAGTWSDDTSLTLALLDSIAENCNVNYTDIMDKFSQWLMQGEYTALGCLLNTNSFQDCVLKAVNLGDDTDTVGAVTGGLAGIYYSSDNIPQKWLDTLLKRQYIEELCVRFERELP